MKEKNLKDSGTQFENHRNIYMFNICRLKKINFPMFGVKQLQKMLGPLSPLSPPLNPALVCTIELRAQRIASGPAKRTRGQEE